MRRSAVAAVACVLALLAGCGEDEQPPGGQTGPNRVEITFDGDSVTPNGERVRVDAGEELELVVTADAPGELHVHTAPEQELAYEEGTSTLTLTIDEPGVVDVESHELGVVVVQLEVG